MATTIPQNPKESLQANPSLDGATPETASQSAQAHPPALHPSRINPSHLNEPAGPFGNRAYQPGAPREGKVARAIDVETPSRWLLWGAIGVIGGALLLRSMRRSA